MYYNYYFSDNALYTFSIILLFAGIIISAIAQAKVKSNFSKYSKVYSNMTGAEAARQLLLAEGITNVQIVPVKGNLTDNFDPRSNTIHLSENVYSARTIAAVGVACHEAGHAVQYAHGYAPLKIRNAVIPVTKIGSTLAMPLVIIGLLLSFQPLALLGVIFFGLALFFQVVTLPVEFNASRRAINVIELNGLVPCGEEVGVKKVLSAAALTYVAAMLVSLAQFLRLLAIVNGRKK